MEPVAPSNTEGGVKMWERAWSVTELKRGSAEWSLASDAGVSGCIGNPSNTLTQWGL